MLTAIRPLLRRVPDPPPVTGRLPGFALRDGRGLHVGPEDLAGRIHIAARADADCEGPCAELLSGLGRIGRAYRERRVEGIGLLAIVEGPADGAARERAVRRLGELARAGDEQGGEEVQVLFGSPEEVAPVARALFGEGPERRPLAIIDAGGRLRGRYGADALGLDEVYNRAQHVKRD